VRIRILMVAFVVLAGVFCAHKSDIQTSSAAPAKWPKEALSPLTEDELAQFIKALPAFSAALKAANWTLTQPRPKEGEGPAAFLTPYVEGMNVPGVDESLRAFGGWRKLRPTLYKVLAASGALIHEGPPPTIASTGADTSAAAKKALKAIEVVIADFSQVPPANKQMVKSHERELQALQALGQ
jgi:hypothetical protein